MDRLFAEFIRERVYLHNVSPKTRSWYETAWKAFKASQSGSDELGRRQLQAFVVSLRERGVRPVSCNTYIKALNAFCGWLQHEGHTEQRLELPSLKTEQRVIVTLTEAEIRRLVQFRPKTFNHWRIHTLVCLLLDTGMRIEEALGLGVHDVDLDNLLATVFGKGRKERRIPFSFELRKLVFRFLQIRERAGVPGTFLFSSRRGTRWGQRNALRSHYLLLKRLGIQKSGFHRLRHTFATQYLRAGGEVVRLSRILGHTQITTTMRYTHLMTEDLQAPHQRLSLLNRIR
jgi:integrase/recombinase XerD